MSVFVVLLAAAVASPAFAATRPTARQEREFGVRMAEQGLWREARFRFERAIELQPGDAKSLNNLAVALEHLGDFAAAKETYQKAIALRPKDDLIQQNYDLFSAGEDKRQRHAKRPRAPYR